MLYTASRCTASSSRGCYSRRESELAVIWIVVFIIITVGVCPWVLRAFAHPTGVEAIAALRKKPGRGRLAISNVSPTASVLPRGNGATALAAATARANTKCLRVMFDYRTWPARRTHRFPSVVRGFPASSVRNARAMSPAAGPQFETAPHAGLADC